MSIAVKVEPIDRDIQLIISDDLSPQAQSEMLAQEARNALREGEKTDQDALGYTPAHLTYVDGRKGSNENTVSPKGTILYEFDIALGMFQWIFDQLELHSPIGGGSDPHAGRFRSSITLYVDGVESEIDENLSTTADEYVFTSTVPYARKIEMGRSNQAPDGVFEAVAALARSRFGNVGKISFGFRSVNGGAIGEWAKSGSAAAHALRHKRRGANAAAWLTHQPAIIVTLK